MTIFDISRFHKMALLAAAIVVSTTWVDATGSIAHASTDKEAIALSLANLLRAARTVISDKQAHINDHTIGFKGVTAARVVMAAKDLYKEKTNEDLDALNRATLHGRLIQAELDAIAEVVNDVQDRINRKGVAFKGFLPAIFAANVAGKFRAKSGATAEMKLTAPENYVRNRANLPDSWESGVIEAKFKSSNHLQGQHVAAEWARAGKPAFRLILPEYYTESCLSCHGGPKGGRDITGGIKEGGKPGDLGGAISVVIFN